MYVCMYVCMYKAHRQTQCPMAGLAELDVVQQARGSLLSKSSLLQGTQEIDEENLDKKQAAAARCPMCIEEELHTKTLPQIQHTHTTLECSMGHYRNQTQKVISFSGRAAAAAEEEFDEDNVQGNVPTLEKTKLLLLLLLLLLLQTPTDTDTDTKHENEGRNLEAVSKEPSITLIGTEWLQQIDQIKLALPKPTKNETNKNKNKSPQKSGQTKQPTTHNLATTTAAAAATTSFLTATKKEGREKKETQKKKSIVLECCSLKY